MAITHDESFREPFQVSGRLNREFGLDFGRRPALGVNGRVTTDDRGTAIRYPQLVLRRKCRLLARVTCRKPRWESDSPLPESLAPVQGSAGSR